MSDEAIADLVSMGIWSLLLWSIGFLEFSRSHPIAVPIWLSMLCGKGRRRVVYLRPLAVQILGALSAGWATILAMFVSSHEQRVYLFSLGSLGLLLFVGLFVALRSRQNK